MTAQEYSKPALISIAGTDVQQVLYKGEPVVTFAMVDDIHQRPDGTAGRTFRENRPRFVEGEDYVDLTSDEIRRMSETGTFPPRSARGTLITRRGYLKLVKPLTDDRAWEVQGEMIDRYFAVEKLASLAPEVLEEIRRTDGISRMLAHKVTEQGKDIATLVQAVNALVTIVQPSVPGVVIRHGKTAGAILRAAGFTNSPTRLALWFGNRLEAAGCRVEGRIDTGTGHSRLFDPDKAEIYLKNGGAAAVEKKIAERRGQGALALSGRALSPYLPPDMPEGMGAVILGGKLVFFDTARFQMDPEDKAVIVQWDGSFAISGASNYTGHRFAGERSGLGEPKPNAYGGANNEAVIILGKVTEVRAIRPRPVLVAG